MPAFQGVDKPLVAMIHLPALPGAANYDGRPVPEIARQAAIEARQLADAGFDGVMLQNTHDRPARLRVRAGTIAAMSAIAVSVRAAASIELGINVHKNDAEAALAVAVGSAASFVRVKVLVGAVIGVEGQRLKFFPEADKYIVNDSLRLVLVPDVFERKSYQRRKKIPE